MHAPRTSRAVAIARLSAIALLIGAGLVVAPQAASAASHSGQIQAKGAGSAYSPMGSQVALSAAPGGSATFYLRVVNSGSTAAQFKVYSYSFGVSRPSFFDGTTEITDLVVSSDGYFTNYLLPGQNQQLTVKVAMPESVSPEVPRGVDYTYVLLYGTDGATIGAVDLYTSVKAPAKGTTAADVFVRQGSQPYVGGSINGAAGAPATAVGASAKFTVKVQNDSAVATKVVVGLDAANCFDSYSATMKAGTLNVTGAAFAHTLVTPTLAANGGNKVFTVTVTHDYPCLFSGRYQIIAYPIDGADSGRYQTLVVPPRV